MTAFILHKCSYPKISLNFHFHFIKLSNIKIKIEYNLQSPKKHFDLSK